MKKISTGILILIVIVSIGVTIISYCNSRSNENVINKSEPYKCEDYKEATYYEEDDWYYSRHAKMYYTVWENFEQTDSSIETPQQLLNEIDKNVKCISEYLNKPDWEKQYRGNENREIIINVHATNEKPSVGGGNYGEAYLNISLQLLDYDLLPLTHELTHLINPGANTHSLREGLATYMTSELGYEGVHRFGAPIHNLAKHYITDEYEDLISVIGYKLPSMSYYFSQMNAFYNLSHSFTKYLIDEFGIEPYMQIYESDNLLEDYKKIYGKPYSRLKEEWLGFLDTVEPYEYTYEELAEKNLANKQSRE